MNNSIKKLTVTQFENLTKEQAFEYAKKINFKKAPYYFCRLSKTQLIEYARELNFKNVPKWVIDILGRGYFTACYYAEALNYKNVPKTIIDRIAMYPYYSWEYAKNVLINKNLPFT